MRSGARELASGEQDLVLGVGVPEGDGVRGEVLFSDRLVSLLRAGHPAARQPLTLRRFVELPHVLVSPQGHGDSAVDVALRERKLVRRLVLRVPHFLSAPLFIAESDAIITLPERVARAVAPQHRLVIKQAAAAAARLLVQPVLAHAQRRRRRASMAARAFVGGR